MKPQLIAILLIVSICLQIAILIFMSTHPANKIKPKGIVRSAPKDPQRAVQLDNQEPQMIHYYDEGFGSYFLDDTIISPYPIGAIVRNELGAFKLLFNYMKHNMVTSLWEDIFTKEQHEVIGPDPPDVLKIESEENLGFDTNPNALLYVPKANDNVVFDAKEEKETPTLNPTGNIGIGTIAPKCFVVLANKGNPVIAVSKEFKKPYKHLTLCGETKISDKPAWIWINLGLFKIDPLFQLLFQQPIGEHKNVDCFNFSHPQPAGEKPWVDLKTTTNQSGTASYGE